MHLLSGHLTPREIINRVRAKEVYRFTLNGYSPYNSVTNMLTHLDWSSLENRRNELRLQMLYKIIHQLVDIDIDDLLPPCPHYHVVTHSDFYSCQQE